MSARSHRLRVPNSVPWPTAIHGVPRMRAEPRREPDRPLAGREHRVRPPVTNDLRESAIPVRRLERRAWDMAQPHDADRSGRVEDLDLAEGA